MRAGEKWSEEGGTKTKFLWKQRWTNGVRREAHTQNFCGNNVGQLAFTNVHSDIDPTLWY